MRTIKFRAWDMAKREMFSPSSISFKDGVVWVSGAHGENRLEYELAQPHASIMQFTGLHDKNGKEIYEGDLVVLGGKYPIKKIPQIVGYDAGYLSYGIVYDTGEMMRKLTPLEIVKGIEIIGNIYENPSLLTPTSSQGENEKR